MAELGAIASGMGIASLAIQIGNGVLKLKSIWDEVKEAPEEIKYLIDEIETLSLVLSEIADSDDNEGSDMTPIISDCAAAKCIEMCRKGADILSGVVKELDVEMTKRKRVGGFKTVLKKGTISRLRERLKSAQIMLMISHQTYLG